MGENSCNYKIPVLVFLAALIVFPASAQSFGYQTGEPLPNITEINIYDVTGLSSSQKEVSGDLEASGLNQSFTVLQDATQRQYRFSFKIVNDGDTDWLINSSDELYHDGLNSSWTVDKIWYNISQDYDSGTFSSGRVTWNTSKNGVLNPGETMYAKYLVTPTIEASQSFEQHFQVNDSLNGSGSEDYHDLTVTNLGYLDIAINDPPNDTVVKQNTTFLVNATLKCLDGQCGQVNGSARYNESSSQVLIPETSSKPFYTINKNTKICEQNLSLNEKCYISWNVNATGDTDNYYKVDVNASSSYSQIAEKNTVNRWVRIDLAVLMSLNWSTTDFGILDPGMENQPAQGNDNMTYNITVDDDSMKIDNLWMRATDLISQKFPDNYSIGAQNLSYSFTNDVTTEKTINNTYGLIGSNIAPDTVLTTYFWLDVPTGIYKGGYNGTIYVKANATG